MLIFQVQYLIDQRILRTGTGPRSPVKEVPQNYTALTLTAVTICTYSNCQREDTMRNNITTSVIHNEGVLAHFSIEGNCSMGPAVWVIMMGVSTKQTKLCTLSKVTIIIIK